MKTLLLNGCSFTHRWNPSKKFVRELGCDRVENISKVSTSFQRTCRTTIEWIAINGNPSELTEALRLVEDLRDTHTYEDERAN